MSGQLSVSFHHRYALPAQPAAVTPLLLHEISRRLFTWISRLAGIPSVPAMLLITIMILRCKHRHPRNLLPQPPAYRQLPAMRQYSLRTGLSHYCRPSGKYKNVGLLTILPLY